MIFTILPLLLFVKKSDSTKSELPKEVIVSSLLLNQISKAQNKREKHIEIMTSYHHFNMFDGSVLVAENGKIIYEAAFGMANREWNIANRG